MTPQAQCAQRALLAEGRDDLLDIYPLPTPLAATAKGDEPAPEGTVVTLEELTLTDLAQQDAEEAARELARELERLGSPLDDIEVIAPCPTCRRTRYTISLGTLHPDQTRAFTRALRQLRTKS